MSRKSPVREGETFTEFQARLRNWHGKDWVEHLNDEDGLGVVKERLRRLTELSRYGLFGIGISLILFLSTAKLDSSFWSIIFCVCLAVLFVWVLFLVGKGARPFGQSSSFKMHNHKGNWFD